MDAERQEQRGWQRWEERSEEAGEEFDEHVLDGAGIDRIAGLRNWFNGGLETLFGPGANSYRDGNIIMGGAGSDQMMGRAGFDMIDGDAWLNVRIRIRVNGVEYSAESLNSSQAAAGQYAGKVYHLGSDGRPDFSTLKDAISAGGDMTLFAFDLLQLDGADLTGLTTVERKERLRPLIDNHHPRLQFAEHILGPGEPRPDLTVVVANDDGGSIFATLEQGSPAHADRFERLFGTPHHVDLASLCAASRTPHWRVDSLAELEHALANPNGGIEVVEAVVRRDNRRELDARIRALTP